MNQDWIEQEAQPSPVPCDICGQELVYMPSQNRTAWLLMGCETCIANDKARVARKEKQAFIDSIPYAYREAELTDLKGYDELIQAYEQEADGIMFITGAAGIGKTHALYALYRQAESDGRRMKYVDLREFLFRLKVESSEDYFNNGYYVQNLAEFQGVLLLDDLGSESASKVTIEAVEIIIAGREKWKPGLTVITSNLSLREVREHFDDRIASRLSGGKVVALKAHDRRLKKGGGE